MKKILVLFAVVAFTAMPFSGHAKKLQAFMSYSTFWTPGDGPYIETYLTVVGSSAVFVKNDSGRFQGNIEITLIFRQGDVIKQFKKYNLLSPEVADTLGMNLNFIDQQRFLLAEGSYDVEIIIADVNDKAEPYKAYETIDIFYPADKVNISGIQLVEKFSQATSSSILTKNGYDMVPYILNYYPQNVGKLIFYAEVYNTLSQLGAEEKYLLSMYIESYENKQLSGNLIKTKKETARAVNVVFGEFDITGLPSGNYNIVIEVRNKLNEQLAVNKLFFQRNNPSMEVEMKDLPDVNISNSFVENITSTDTLTDYIKCLYPISSQTERTYASNVVRRGELSSMQKYFFNFWMTRNNKNPEGAWKLYYIEVQKVNNDFSTKIKKGYETDRGRVYLQYGPPNSIIQSLNEPSAYPYEIWHYYTLLTQKNKKFVFYNPDLVTNEFILIHSDATGEVYDYKWRARVFSRNNPYDDIDNDGVKDHWGDKTNEYYNNPR